MEQAKPDVQGEVPAERARPRRRDLLPGWIKAFAWFFMILGASAPLGIALGVAGYSFDLSLYGFETRDPLSFLGLTLIAFMFMKGVAAFSLWTGKNWAVTFALVDAALGVLICIYAMVLHPAMNGQPGFFFRLEIVFLVPYLIKLLSIRGRWRNANAPA